MDTTNLFSIRQLQPYIKTICIPLFNQNRAMDEGVSRRDATAGRMFDRSSLHVNFLVENWRYECFGCLCHYHCTSDQYTSSASRCSYQKDKGAKAGNRPETTNNTLSEVVGY